MPEIVGQIMPVGLWGQMTVILSNTGVSGASSGRCERCLEGKVTSDRCDT